MNILFPPVLEDQANALPFITTNGIYTIYFTMPEINDPTLINHIQVVIKERESGRYAVNSKYSPDSQTLFLPKAAPYWEMSADGNCKVNIPYKFFLNGSPKVNTTYIAQVRFGSGVIPIGTGGGTIYDTIPVDFSRFVTWRSQEISKVPSGFGEWSNQQKVYFYGASEVSLDYNLYDYVPEIEFFYQPQYKEDILEKVVISYSYADFLNSKNTKTQSYSGFSKSNNKWEVNFKIPMAPVVPIKVNLTAITVNRTVLSSFIYIYPNNEASATTKTNIGKSTKYFGDFFEQILNGEELYDGVIAKGLHITDDFATKGLGDDWVSIYRVNMLNFETFRILDTKDVSHLYDFYFKDFGIEMGEQYLYVAVRKTKDSGIDKSKWILNSIDPWDETNAAYGRLMDMDSISFLDDKYHQLRIQGNVQVSAFKRNTSDVFTTTIGSKYPFYSRPGEMNYRTLSLSGVITINFDPTGTFLMNNPEKGLYWVDEDKIQNQLLVLNRDLYGDLNFSRTRLRMKASSGNEYLEELGVQSSGDIRGPKSIYDSYQYINAVSLTGDIKENESVYIERKFREKVMDWLSNGKPKLFRSETEGNMIVMLSNISFSPVEKTSRIIYSVSMTLTEIAEYNLQNMINYDLNGVNIQTRVTRMMPYKVVDGEEVSEFVYKNLIFIEKSLESCFERTFDTYTVKPGMAQKVNEILNKITEYNFLRGIQDGEEYDQIIFIDSPKFDIPSRHHAPLHWRGWPGIDLWEGVRYNNSNKEDHYDNVFFKVIEGKLPSALSIDKTKIVWDGVSDVGSRKNPKVVIRAYETSNGDPDGPVIGYDDFVIDVGYIYYSLQLDVNMSKVDAIGQLTTDDFISIPVSGKYGTKFSDASLNPKDIDYLYKVENLPLGLNFGKYIDTDGTEQFGIYGRFTNSYEAGEIPKISIQVKDANGEIRDETIDFADRSVKKKMVLNKNSISLGYLEIGKAISEIDLTKYVDFGLGEIKFETGGVDVPRGLFIGDKKLKGTPIVEKESGGYFRITVGDFPPGSSTPYSTDEILVYYNAVVPTFTFKNLNTDPSGTTRIMDYYGTNPDLNYEIERGTVFADRDILTLAVDGVKVISGGLPFIDEEGKPYYKFELSNDSNLKVSTKGVLQSKAKVGTMDRKILYITAIDARGARIEETIKYERVITDISFAEKKGALKLKPAIVDSYPSPVDNYKVIIDTSKISGGFYDERIGYLVEPGEGFPDYLEIVKSGADFVIQGKGTEDYPHPVSLNETSFKIKIYDSRKVETNCLEYDIIVGKIVPVLNCATVLPLPTEQYSMGQLFDINLTDLLDISGGDGKFTLAAATDADATIMAPYTIDNIDKDGASTTDFWIHGKVVDEKKRVFNLKLTSGEDTTYQEKLINVEMPSSKQALKCFLKPWREPWDEHTSWNPTEDQGMFRNNEVLICYKGIPDLPYSSIKIENAITHIENFWADPAIPRIPTGVSEWKYFFNGLTDSGYLSPPDATGLNGIKLTGTTIEGIPVSPQSAYLIEPYFKIEDHYAGGVPASNSETARYHSQIGTSRYTMPRIIEPLLSLGTIQAGTVYRNKAFESDPLFAGPMGPAGHPDIKYYWVIDDHTEILLNNNDPLGDNTRLYWNEEECRIYASLEKGLGVVNDKDSFTIKAVIPAASFRSNAGDFIQVATLEFKTGAQQALQWKNQYGTLVDNLTLIQEKTKVESPVEIDMSRYIYGGASPYTLSVAPEASEWTTDGLKLKRNTPTGIVGPETVPISLTDSNGAKITGEIKYEGSFLPFKVDSSGWQTSIPSRSGSDQTFSWKDAGFLDSSISGGSGNYLWKVVNMNSPSGSLAPYIDGASPFPTKSLEELAPITIGYNSYEERKFGIQIMDVETREVWPEQTGTTPIYWEMTVGEIKGLASQQKPIKIPPEGEAAGIKGASFNHEFNISDYFVGGTTFAFDPSGEFDPWGEDRYEGKFKITVNATGDKFTISGKYPDKITDEIIPVVKLKDSGIDGYGTDLLITIVVAPTNGDLSIEEGSNYGNLNPWNQAPGAEITDVIRVLNGQTSGDTQFKVANFETDLADWSEEHFEFDGNALKVKGFPDRSSGTIEETHVKFNIIEVLTEDEAIIVNIYRGVTLTIGKIVVS